MNVSIAKYCDSAKAQFIKSKDFESKRQFLLDHIEKVLFFDDKITIVGSVPIRLKAYDDPNQPTEVSKIEFKIPGEITRKERVASWHQNQLRNQKISFT